MRLLVCGGRDFVARFALYDFLTVLHARRRVHVLIHGAARGADTFAGEWADASGVFSLRFPIRREDWRRYGRAAGGVRNQEMLDDGKPDLVVAFPGGGGTADMVRRAVRAHVEVVHALKAA